MRTIWKFPLSIVDYQQIGPPRDAIPRHVGLDPAGKPCIWFEVDTDEPPATAEVYVVGTGNPIPPEAKKYLGSFNQDRFVWHVFITGESLY